MKRSDRVKEYLNRIIEELETFLKSHGAQSLNELILYRSTGHFLIGSMGCGVVCCWLGLKWQWSLGILGFMIGLFLPAIILYMSDEQDNAAILKDLKWLYETIIVQLRKTMLYCITHSSLCAFDFSGHITHTCQFFLNKELIEL